MFAIRKRSEIFHTVHSAGCSNIRENFREAQPCTERSRMAEKKDDKEKNGWAVMDGDGVIEDFLTPHFFQSSHWCFSQIWIIPWGSTEKLMFFLKTHGELFQPHLQGVKNRWLFHGETVVYQWNIMSLLGCVAIPICWYCFWLVDGTWWY